MPTLLKLSFTFILTLFFSSCSDDNLEERIIGGWMYEQTYSVSEGIDLQTVTYKGSIKFYEDGTGDQIHNSGYTWQFYWKVENKKVNFRYLNGGLTIPYDVDKNKKDEQIWTGKTPVQYSNGQTVESNVTLHLSK